MDLLPDVRQGTFEIRDLLNLITGTVGVLVGGLGLHLAWRSIKLGEEQARIASRQAAIAERQHLILEEQLATGARPTLWVVAGAVFVSNKGPQPVSGFLWRLLIPTADIGEVLGIVDTDKKTIYRDPDDVAIEGTTYASFKNFDNRQLNPEDVIKVASVQFTDLSEPREYFWRWAIVAGGRTFPGAEGYGKIHVIADN